MPYSSTKNCFTNLNTTQFPDTPIWHLKKWGHHHLSEKNFNLKHIFVGITMIWIWLYWYRIQPSVKISQQWKLPWTINCALKGFIHLAIWLFYCFYSDSCMIQICKIQSSLPVSYSYYLTLSDFCRKKHSYVNHLHGMICLWLEVEKRMADFVVSTWQ